MSALLSGARWVAIEAVVSRVLQLLSALFVARVLGPEVMGTVALILVALEIFKLFSEMGITQALIHQKEPTSEQIATLYTLNWVLALLAYSAIYFSTPYVAAFFENEQLSELMRVAGLSVLISALGQQMFALLQKELDFRVMAIISMVSSVVNLIVAISLVALGWGVWSIIIAQLSAALIRSCCAFAYGCWNKLFSGFGFSFKAVKSMLSFGLYQTGAMSLNMINSRADQIIIGKTMGSVALGVYSMGTQITLQAMQQIKVDITTEDSAGARLCMKSDREASWAGVESSKFKRGYGVRLARKAGGRAQNGYAASAVAVQEGLARVSTFSFQLETGVTPAPTGRTWRSGILRCSPGVLSRPTWGPG